MKMISLRVPTKILARIDKQAKAESVTRTDLLLRPWTMSNIAVVSADGNTLRGERFNAHYAHNMGGEREASGSGESTQTSTRNAAHGVDGDEEVLSEAHQISGPNGCAASISNAETVRFSGAGAPPDRCPLCSGPLVTWGAGKRCVQCRRNY